MHSTHNRYQRNRRLEAVEVILSGWVAVWVAVLIFVWCIVELMK